MAVYFQISRYFHVQVKQTMAGKSVQHMIEERDSGIDLIDSLSVQIDGQGDICLFRFPCTCSDSVFHGSLLYSFPSNRTLMELAWAVRCSASANFSMSVWIFSSASLEYEMILDFLIKSSTERGEKNLAVPFVGSTWFGPAK